MTEEKVEEVEDNPEKKIEDKEKLIEREEKLMEKEEELIQRKEDLKQKEIAGGNSEAGMKKPKEKPLTDEEYAEKLDRGEVNPLKEDGYI